jgi:hypothetical protein
MSRLEAIAKGLYYRTQDPLAEPLARLLQLPPTGVVNILDPCAGAGLFHERLFACMADVAQQCPTDATLVSYGVEPNCDRAQQARRVFTHLLCADFFHTRISKGRFQLSVLNPPYDEDLTSTQNEEGVSVEHQRLEFRFLRRTTQLLAPEAVLVYIIPQAQILPAARYLAANYTALHCWRYPDLPWAPPEERDSEGHPKAAIPLYQQFHQVVIIGVRRRVAVPPAEPLTRHIQEWAYAGTQLPPLPLEPAALASVPPWQVPADQQTQRMPNRSAATRPRAQEDVTSGNDLNTEGEEDEAIVFTDPTLEINQLARRLQATGGGVWADRDYRADRWPDLTRLQLGMERPLGPLRLGHLITLAAVGLLNGRVLEGPDGRTLLVKGACRKEIVVEEEVEHSPRGSSTITKTETEKFVIALWATDLATGELLHIV